MDTHSDHYKSMDLQPYAVMRSMGILKEYLQAAAIKYIMRQGAKNPDDPKIEWLNDIEKAISVLNSLHAELLTESEGPL